MLRTGPGRGAWVTPAARLPLPASSVAASAATSMVMSSSPAEPLPAPVGVISMVYTLPPSVPVNMEPSLVAAPTVTSAAAKPSTGSLQVKVMVTRAALAMPQVL